MMTREEEAWVRANPTRSVRKAILAKKTFHPHPNRNRLLLSPVARVMSHQGWSCCTSVEWRATAKLTWGTSLDQQAYQAGHSAHRIHEMWAQKLLVYEKHAQKAINFLYGLKGVSWLNGYSQLQNSPEKKYAAYHKRHRSALENKYATLPLIGSRTYIFGRVFSTKSAADGVLLRYSCRNQHIPYTGPDTQWITYGWCWKCSLSITASNDE